MSVSSVASSVALVAVVAVWTWALNPPATRDQKLDEWVQRDLLGVPEWAHILGLTPALYQPMENHPYALANFLSVNGWEFPYAAASDLRSGKPFHEVERQYR